jgi:hypothetical protein
LLESSSLGNLSQAALSLPAHREVLSQKKN